MEPITVMIVDDHSLFRGSTAFFLRQNKNIEVVAETGNGEEAIEIVREKRPNIMLLDLNMYPLNGYEVLKMTRKVSPLTRVIGVTMHSQPAYAKKMMRLGARGYLTKNSDTDEMLEAITEVMKSNTFICRQVKEILAEQVLHITPENPANMNLLSERENQVLQKVREGSSSKEIGAELHISFKTVMVHRSNILKKLNMRNSVSLMNYLNSIAFES
jgi:two-component system invasion response regulator UvrY